jgi:predicted ATPase
LEALSHTVENVRGIPVLLIVTFRPEFNPPWTGQSHVTAVTLNRLHQSEATAIVERIAGDKPLSQALIAEIIERTDGVPLFVEEMTKAILESGETQAAHIVSAVPSPSIGVPASLHASLMARLDRLGPAKQVAQIGAAIGREFSYELLSAAAHRKDSELVDALERLTDSGLLYREGVPPHATFLFKHALVQDAAYGTLLREARRNIHERIAEALSKTFPQSRETQPEVLAHHFTQAGLTEAAVHWWGKAGQQALVHSAMLEAEGHLRKGLNILATLPDGTERQEYELDLQMALADAVAATHGLTHRPGQRP